jgi:hypothetical protein
LRTIARRIFGRIIRGDTGIRALAALQGLSKEFPFRSHSLSGGDHFVIDGAGIDGERQSICRSEEKSFTIFLGFKIVFDGDFFAVFERDVVFDRRLGLDR